MNGATAYSGFQGLMSTCAEPRRKSIVGDRMKVV
jgi:hypothetical protein